MRHRVLIAALVLAVTSTSANAAQTVALDLICTGQVADAAGAVKPFTTQISLDLQAKRWCDRQAGCPYVFPILARHGDDLQLLAVKTPLNEAAFDVDLKTGAFVRNTRIPDRSDSATAAKGVCKPAAFTPLP